MAGRGRRAVAAELTVPGERFARWRRGRVRGARIPHELWQLAIELAGRYGVSRVAGVVRVGYYELQKQCRLAADRVDSAPRTLPERAPRFIELPRSVEPTSASAKAPGMASAEAGECVIELDHVSGHRLRLRIPVADAALIAPIIRQLWEAR
ncbi:MAG: hypothetical protein U1A77_00420 [Pirellulales bacterium]